ncbi:MAG: M20/M25/M40 family metallo-hydrolase, partial [Lachnospiraceae bacterium]|nr:M20/M25/M40 family metallo-hydrolase [Lachnospiraceae bacterium]
YPAWEYRRESELRELMAETYRDVYGKEPVIQAIHAGLECGLFGEKIPGLDMVSMGPNMVDIHTPQERMSISSVARVWEYLLEVLRRMK